MKVRPSKRKRSMVDRYDFDITALGERHVDKFRNQTKGGQESVAT